MRKDGNRWRLRGRKKGRRAGLRGECGQAAVEAAFVLPVVFLVVLLLVQPGILLYDRMVMGSAAAEACRLLATASDAAGVTRDNCEDYVRRRLGAIPQHDCFHVHEGGCTWSIDFTGDETSEEVIVRISTEVKPLPLLDFGAALMGLANERGNVVVRVEASCPTQPAWAREAADGTEPAAWAGSWADEE